MTRRFCLPHSRTISSSEPRSKLTLVIGGEQGLFDEGADLLVGLAQPPGVVGVGRHALQAVEQRLLQRLDVLVLAADAGASEQAVPWAVCSHWLQYIAHSPSGHMV